VILRMVVAWECKGDSLHGEEEGIGGHLPWMFAPTIDGEAIIN